MATIQISENDKKIIYETAEDFLRKNPGRTRLFRIWTAMKKKRSELAELHKSHKGVKGFWNEIIAIMIAWHQRHSSKIGYAQIKEGTKRYNSTVSFNAIYCH